MCTYLLGRTVQVDPIKPTLKAPGIKLLKLKYDKPLSNFAFKFNLRRYNMAARAVTFEAGAYTRSLLSST
jgi:hypothetical protein